MESVNGVVIAINSRYGRLELFADLDREFSLLQSLHNGPGSHSYAHPIDIGTPFPGIKQTGSEAGS